MCAVWCCVPESCKIKVKFTLEEAMKAQREVEI
jgi:hypothetical protein